MTDLQTDDGPLYTLPELPQLDPRSALALAINSELDTQLAGQDVAVAINPGPIADAVLAVLAIDAPRIPAWTGDPRTVGGGRLPDQEYPQPAITVEPEHDDRGGSRTGYVAFNVEMTWEDQPVRDRAVVPVADAETWALAVLAACRATRE